MQLHALYAEITARIMEGLAQGVKPWRCGWDRNVPLTVPRNAFTGKPYSGGNVLWLWLKCADGYFSCHDWITYKQAQELLAQQAQAKGIEVVKHRSRRGGTYYTDSEGRLLGGVREKAKAIHCMRIVVKEEEDKRSGEVVERAMPCTFTVFNLDQVEGLDREALAPTWEPIEAMEALFQRAFAPGEIGYHEEGVQPYYSLTNDCVVMPNRDRFTDRYELYATLAHEAAHATQAKHRLNRTFEGTPAEKYAREELVAEFSSAFLCARYGIEGDHSRCEASPTSRHVSIGSLR